MEFSTWMREQSVLGATPTWIAEQALIKPVAIRGSHDWLHSTLESVARILGVSVGHIHIVGSARFGFSLLDGTDFDPRFSDLDIAVVDENLYSRCIDGISASEQLVRYPERQLPRPEGSMLRHHLDELSRSLLTKCAYVSVCAYPTRSALIGRLATRIEAYLASRGAAAERRPANPKDAEADAHAEQALRMGLPRFTVSIPSSNPNNSSPYVLSQGALRRAFGQTEVRARLLEAFDEAVADLSDVIEVECCLVGGSFVDVDCEEPADLDAVVFYKAKKDGQHEIGKSLSRLSRKFLVRGVDARFVPCDAEPWLLIKLTSFFTELYRSQRGATPNSRGLVLVRPG